jgi:cyclopropane-fatty-acyl-phospholipid synthase
MKLLYDIATSLIDRGLMPDPMIRKGIRILLRNRLKKSVLAEPAEHTMVDFLASMRAFEAIAPVPDKANAQHYEVPAAFYDACLGRQKKYSSCFYPNLKESLDEAEEVAFLQSADHASLQDGQHVLELGCGWGSWSLWMAKRFPNSKITGVSNSHSQRAYIMAQAAERGLTNLEIVTCDMNEFDPRTAASSRMPLHGFDRIVSIEMFEHMRNWEKLLGRVRTWLHDDGRFFAHVFAHQTHPYRFEDEQPEANKENPRVKSHGNWMGEHFFSGGIMPSRDLFHQFSDVLEVEQDWWWDGRHYGRTSEQWLENLDQNQSDAVKALENTPDVAPQVMFRRWRVFFMACAETFAYDQGREWGVVHVRMRK